MNAERDASRFIYEDSCIIEVLPTCGKQWLPVNVEVVPCWLNGDRVGQEREIGVVNLPSFGKRNLLSSIADVCHSKHSADRDRHRSDTGPVLANMSCCAEGERTKAIIVRFELLLEIMPSIPFVIGEFLNPFLHFGMATATVYAKATLNYPRASRAGPKCQEFSPGFRRVMQHDLDRRDENRGGSGTGRAGRAPPR